MKVTDELNQSISVIQKHFDCLSTRLLVNQSYENDTFKEMKTIPKYYLITNYLHLAMAGYTNENLDPFR